MRHQGEFCTAADTADLVRRLAAAVVDRIDAFFMRGYFFRKMSSSSSRMGSPCMAEEHNFQPATDGSAARIILSHVRNRIILNKAAVHFHFPK